MSGFDPKQTQAVNQSSIEKTLGMGMHARPPVCTGKDSHIVVRLNQASSYL